MRKPFSYAIAEPASKTTPSGRSESGARAQTLGGSIVLLVSDDARLHQVLRCAANRQGRMVVRVAKAAGALPVVRVLCPAALLLDLDLPQEASWSIGDSLLHEPGCPPVILITGRTEQFDVKTAIRAGSLVDKSTDPDRLLELVNLTLAMPSSSQAARNATQQVLIRWLRPSDWSAPPGTPFSRTSN